MLIPVAEQMGVLVRAAGDFSIFQKENGMWVVIVVHDFGPECDTPEEALASVICLEQGVPE